MSLPNSSAIDSRSPSERELILCYVTDRRSLHATPLKNPLEPLLERIEAVSAAGVNWIQLREKDLCGKDSASLARDALYRVSTASPHAQPPGPARILLNDRLDVAIAEKAGGVHLSESSVPTAEAKRMLQAVQIAPAPRHDFLIGVSCHSLEAAQSAASGGADYLFFGPVFATPSKAAYGSPQGIERLAQVCESVSIPVLAIGGITPANASSCFSAGASGIAAIRLFQDPSDPAQIVRELLRQFY